MWVYSKFITRNGNRIYASQYGMNVFKFWVDDKSKKETI